ARGSPAPGSLTGRRNAMSDSIVLHLKPGLSGEDAVNGETISGVFGAPGPAFRAAFIRHYEAIHGADAGLRGDGVVVSVIGPTGFAGSAALAAKPDFVNAVTIGRHGHADLYLPDDPALSLRQAAVIVYPRRPGSPVRFR